MIIKSLIGEKISQLENRIIVNGQSFMRSIYYILIRGRQGSDKYGKPISFIKMFVHLINKSEKQHKLLQRHKDKLDEEAIDQIVGDKSKEMESIKNEMSMIIHTSHILHNGMLNLAIACLLDIYYFIVKYSKPDKQKKKDKEKA